MNEEKLSNNLRVVFDPLSEKYIICDRQSAQNFNQAAPAKKPFNLFSKLLSPKSMPEQPVPANESDPPSNSAPSQIPQQPTPSQPSQPPRPTPPPRPNPPPPLPSGSQAIRLSRDIYNDLDALVNAYRQLQDFAEADTQTFENLESQTLIMRATMGNIYRTLSGSPLPPLSGRRIELAENYCASLGIVADFIGDIIDKMIDLMVLINVSSIDRQLLILNATLSSQERTVTNLYNDCRIRGA